MRVNKKTKKTLAIVGAILAGVILLGSLGIINTDMLKKERNPDNLITVDCITLESIDDKTTDVKIDVNEETGVVKLSGKASVTKTYVYASVELEPGTYSFTGADDGRLDTYYMAIVVDDNAVRSDGDPIKISEAGTYDIVIEIQEGCDFKLLGEKLYPLLLPASDAEDASFWVK